jgi:hypothetical protein
MSKLEHLLILRRALENVGIVVLVGPIFADTDDAVEEVVVGGSGRTAIEAGAASIGSHDC